MKLPTYLRHGRGESLNAQANLTAEQVRRKYRGKYIEFDQAFDYTTRTWMYTVHKVYDTIRENTCLAEDVGTNMEYCR